MTIFQLKKPRYKWIVLPRKPDGTSNGSQVVLADDVEDWLDTRQVEYDSWTANEEHDFGKGDGIKTYLFFYICIEDPNHAMLFKLTWM